jgi:hypothetical protein
MLAIVHIVNITQQALRTDNFEAFFQARQKALLNRIEQAMGKSLILDANSLEDTEQFEYEEE